MEKTAVILLSGGLDSSVSLALGVERYAVIQALHFNYGQKCAAQELASVRQLCRHYKVDLKVISLPWLKALNDCALVNHRVEMPRYALHNLDHDLAGQAQGVWITNRNGVFINIAACYAESLNAAYILAGFNAEEAVNFPDNSKAFIRAANRALKYSTANKVKVKALTQDLGKSEIVRLGFDLHMPFKLIWSCYENHEAMCGTCSSCLRLRRGIQAAGLQHSIELGFKARD